MASIHKEIWIDLPPDKVWAAVRDFGAVHQRLAQGFILDTRLEGDARVVTFVTGMTIRELLIGIDNETRRLAYAAVGGELSITTPHFRSLQMARVAVDLSGSRMCCRTSLQGRSARSSNEEQML